MTCPRCGRALASAKLSAERVAAIKGPVPLSLGMNYRYCPFDDLVVFALDGKVVGYEGMYEVSDMGRVRSLPRVDAQGGNRKMRMFNPSRKAA